MGKSKKANKNHFIKKNIQKTTKIKEQKKEIENLRLKNIAQKALHSQKEREWEGVITSLNDKLTTVSDSFIRVSLENKAVWNLVDYRRELLDLQVELKNKYLEELKELEIIYSDLLWEAAQIDIKPPDWMMKISSRFKQKLALQKRNSQTSSTKIEDIGLENKGSINSEISSKELGKFVSRVMSWCFGFSAQAQRK